MRARVCVCVCVHVCAVRSASGYAEVRYVLCGVYACATTYAYHKPVLLSLFLFAINQSELYCSVFHCFLLLRTCVRVCVCVRDAASGW